MPDLNSVPPSPRILATSRRQSASQNPSSQESPTAASISLLPSNQQALNQASSGSLPSPPPIPGMNPSPTPGQDNTGVGSGPGPLRHPRPLTAAELLHQVELEQELLVNRLSRDLTLLRSAQNSSVVSNTSSTSASTSTDQAHPSGFTDTHLLSGPGPITTAASARRHHRTSSSVSARSQAATQGSTSTPIPIPQHHPGSAASVLEAARNPRGAPGMSRQNSTASHRSRSRNASPQPFHGSSSLGHSSYTQSHGVPQEHSGGYFVRAAQSTPSVSATPGSELSPGLMPATLRYEETAHYRSELESAKRENDNLKKRVKELEKMLRERRDSDTSGTSGPRGRDRSESASTTTSVSVSGAAGVGSVVGGGANIAGDRRAMERSISTRSVTGSVGVGVPEEELNVGESAASSGLGNPRIASPLSQR
ncbi:hypothetical protein F4778DRAFT_376453 [Xylariomycetidae sp. FL2044]|nr:hypothetical protein F4778DRAFT_376453 [Xylariomycetidae sp. FL2044]